MYSFHPACFHSAHTFAIHPCCLMAAVKIGGSALLLHGMCLTKSLSCCASGSSFCSWLRPPFPLLPASNCTWQRWQGRTYLVRSSNLGFRTLYWSGQNLLRTLLLYERLLPNPFSFLLSFTGARSPLLFDVWLLPLSHLLSFSEVIFPSKSLNKFSSILSAS